MSEKIHYFVYPQYIEEIYSELEGELDAHEENGYPLSCAELFDVVIFGIKHHFEKAGRDLSSVTLEEIMRDYEGEEVSERAWEFLHHDGKPIDVKEGA